MHAFYLFCVVEFFRPLFFEIWAVIYVALAFFFNLNFVHSQDKPMLFIYLSMGCG
tara:strand:+ start:629 stop:793 length:165 start_codon:yes stop_codon:yes gene_type:complete